MRNQPRIVETPIAITIPIDPAMAALCVSSVIYIQRSTLEEVIMAGLSYVCAGIETRKGVLSHKNTNHSNISLARANTPTGVSRVVQKLGEYKGT